MGFIRTDNPLHDFNRWDEEFEEWLEKQPICDECGEHIQDEYLYEIGNIRYCENCIEGFKKYID